MDGELLGILCAGPDRGGWEHSYASMPPWMLGPLLMGPASGRLEGNCLRLAFSIKRWLWATGLEHQPGPRHGKSTFAALTYRRALRSFAKAKPSPTSAINCPSARQQPVIDAVATMPLDSVGQGPQDIERGP